MSITVRFFSNLPQNMNDVPEIARAFFPYIKIDQEAADFIDLRYAEDESGFNFFILSSLGNISETLDIPKEESLLYKKLTKRFAKTVLYNFLKKLTGAELPYGSLTGVRPTKLFYELRESGEDAKEYLIENFFVTPERAALIESVVEGQKDIYNKDPKGADIFVNIPFCPTRCGYCSFISTEITRIKKRIPEYILCVKKEISSIIETVKSGGYTVRSIYVGGGTPTSLSGEELKDMLSALSGFNCEFTVEAGRPDSIDYEKLKALDEINVNRISINPQTFKAGTLVTLGRNHTPEDVYRAYAEAGKFKFSVNMDLIAGLPGETPEDFITSLEKTLELKPENITVHTLSIKRGAGIKNEGAEKSVSGAVRQMTDFARNRLINAGYRPYYMYRQKNMADNLENVGYALDGKQCVYNVDYMEETNTVFSAGAGAISKYVYPQENRIERKANPKGFEDYIKYISLKN